MPPTMPSIGGLSISSPELDSCTTARDVISSYLHQTLHTASSLLRRNFAADGHTRSSSTLVTRSEGNPDPGKLAVSPFAIPNKAVFTLFGLIGAGFVITGIWFFFRAKNGGFHFTGHDFSDYKSSVLRRRGPKGTTLSGATASTKLGGGSIYRDVESTANGSEMSEKKHRRKTRKTRIRDGDLEAGHDPDEDVRAYRHEKPARVGGINREPDSTAWDGNNARTDLLSNRQTTPTSSPAKSHADKSGRRAAGIRKVSSSASTFWTKSQHTGKSSQRAGKHEECEKERAGKHEEREKERQRIKEEARKLQEKGRAASSRDASSRRDFSYAEGDDATTVASEKERREERRARRERRREIPAKRDSSKKDRPQRLLPQQEESDGDLGTKSYAHFIPGLSISVPAASTQSASAPSEVSSYVDERRKKRAGGYRRGRGGDYE